MRSRLSAWARASVARSSARAARLRRRPDVRRPPQRHDEEADGLDHTHHHSPRVALGGHAGDHRRHPDEAPRRDDEHLAPSV